MNKLAKIYWATRAVGIDNLPRRVLQLARSRLGILHRRLPGGELPREQLIANLVEDYRPAEALDWWRRRVSGFFVSPERLGGLRDAVGQVAGCDLWQGRVSRIVDDLEQGRMLLFSHIPAEVGFPPAFNRDPIHRIDWPVGRHWTTYDQFNRDLADLKCVWEASRFPWAFFLSRQFVRSSDPRPAELFRRLFEVWDEQNPYGLTAQWSCGQESTFRMLAWVFSASAFLNVPQPDEAHYHRLTELIWYTARHLEANINFARSQKNNHAVSEAVGLLTVGLLFPEFRRSEVWRAKGRKILAAEVDRQIYDDGSYVQHSLNYHRVMMDGLLWAGRLCELGGEPLDEQVTAAMKRALRWLVEMIDPHTGRVPNYGANDGALVLPLSCCDYTDFRPVAQAMHYLLHRNRCFGPGPWDEKMVWFFGPESLDAPVQRCDRKATFAAPAGGYYILRGPESWAMTRCHSYRDRPNQADMLHLDLWFKGENVLRDGGSYMYYCEPPWQHYFESTRAHNTVTIDGADQMIKGPRFLWFRWTRSRLRRFDSSADGRAGYFQGEHYGYTRLSGRVIHRRTVCRIDDSYVIIDDILGSGQHDVAVRWRLYPGNWEERDRCWQARVSGELFALAVTGEPGMVCRVLCGQESPSPEGWESVYYAEKTAAPTVLFTGPVTLPVSLLTIAGPAGTLPKLVSMDTSNPEAPVLITCPDGEELAETIGRVTAGRVRQV